MVTLRPDEWRRRGCRRKPAPSPAACAGWAAQSGLSLPTCYAPDLLYALTVMISPVISSMISKSMKSDALVFAEACR